jgi:hypothetical protein
MKRMVLAALLLAASSALACGVEVTMRLIGFDKAGERAVVRVEVRGDANTIDVRVVDLKTGEWTDGGGNILSDEDPEATRAKLREQRWKTTQAALIRDGFTITPDYAEIPKKGVELAKGVTLSLEGSSDGESGFSGNRLMVRRGNKSVTAWERIGPVSDSPRITGVFVSPRKNYVLAVEGGCVNGEVKVFEVAKLAELKVK